MTFSIVARCEKTGILGVAVSSSSPAVAARCAYAQAGVGAVASQNITDPALGTRGLALMAAGAGAGETIDGLRRGGKHMAYRQLLAIDSKGETATYSGANTLGVGGEADAKNVACGGNLLADQRIPEIMVQAFVSSGGDLGDRLLMVMLAAKDAGGEAGPIHSAGMKLVDKVPWPIADLRVDWTEDCPILQLEELWRLYKPQLNDYVKRALDPTKAPGYGVPGDE